MGPYFQCVEAYNFWYNVSQKGRMNDDIWHKPHWSLYIMAYPCMREVICLLQTWVQLNGKTSITVRQLNYVILCTCLFSFCQIADHLLHTYFSLIVCYIWWYSRSGLQLLFRCTIITHFVIEIMSVLFYILYVLTKVIHAHFLSYNHYLIPH